MRDEAVARLHELLLRAARFETGRRKASHPHLRGDIDEIAQEAADDALLSVLARLDDFRGLSRFTTWAYKLALYQASVKVRRRLAGSGDPRRGRGVERSLERGARARPGGRAERAARGDPDRDRGGTDPAPAARPRRARAERGAHRRARGAAADHPRRALQVPARRAPQAPWLSRGGRATASGEHWRRCRDGTQREGARPRPAARAGGARGEL